MLLSIYICADPSGLSRPDKSTMSQQTLMELLMSEFDDKSIFRDTDGCFVDIAEWRGLSFNSSHEVTKIDWDHLKGLFDSDDDDAIDPDDSPKAGGSIDFKWLPETLIDLGIPERRLRGTLDTFALPRTLMAIDLSDNRLEGTFETRGLPEGMISIFLAKNGLSGTLDIAGLPKSMQRLSIEKNAFSGEFHFQKIPPSMQYLSLSNNKFHGRIDFSALPETMVNLRIEMNAFETPRILIAPSREMTMCVLDQGDLQEVQTADGKRLGYANFLHDKSIRLIWKPLSKNAKKIMDL